MGKEWTRRICYNVTGVIDHRSTAPGREHIASASCPQSGVITQLVVSRHVLERRHSSLGAHDAGDDAWVAAVLVPIGGADVFGSRASNHFADGAFSAADTDSPASADAALVMVERDYRRWRTGVRALGEDGLFRPCGPAEGPFSEEPLLTLVLHINREFLHHAAEVALLRDLYRDTVAKGRLALNPPAHP